MSARTSSWVVLIAGGLLEILWAALLREAGFLDRPWLFAAGLVVSVFSVLALGWAMRVLPLGTGYAAWIGTGTAGSVVVGLLFFGESAAPLRLIFLVAILVGLIGLGFTEGREQEPGSREVA